MNVAELKTVAEYGMGLVSFCVLLALFWKVVPVLTRLEHRITSALAQNQEVIRNNTEALQQQARANDNVANALALIGSSTTTVCSSLEKHDLRAEAMMMDIIKIRSEINHLSKGGAVA